VSAKPTGVVAPTVPLVLARDAGLGPNQIVTQILTPTIPARFRVRVSLQGRQGVGGNPTEQHQGEHKKNTKRTQREHNENTTRTQRNHEARHTKISALLVSSVLAGLLQLQKAFVIASLLLSDANLQDANLQECHIESLLRVRGAHG
jgi:hypothetical protein